MKLIIAEKPSVARDLGRVLGARASGEGQLEGDGFVVTWCIGHLVELEEPAAYDASWKRWRPETLPMLPSPFKLRPARHAVAQLRRVVALLRSNRFTTVINACDAGREGELIFRYVYQMAGGGPPLPPIERLWISSLTDEAIRRGFAALRPGAQLDALGDAARSRSEADWLVGLNATRAVTLRHRHGAASTLFSIGRVQTPTLAMLVGREQEIRRFVARDYFQVRATLQRAGGERFAALWKRGAHTRFASAAVAAQVVERCRARAPDKPLVERVTGKTAREPPPLLFDLTALQRTANRRFGWSATRTLEIAQALYERHKLLTYPRTDSRHLTSDVAKELPRLFGALAAVPAYAGFVAGLIARPPRPSRRVVDDAKVSDHHAIIPTGKAVKLDGLDGDERRLFDLVARRFIGVFFPDAEIALTEVVIRVGPPSATVAVTEREAEAEAGFLSAAPAPPDRFVAKGRVRLVAGWQEVAGIDGSQVSDGGEPTPSLPALVEGERLDGEFDALAKRTTPPERHTEATLLAAMESAGRAIDDEALRAAMRDCGLGTPATRAAIIETLLRREYVVRVKRHLVPTATGMELIVALPVPSLASPELTGSWEARLARIARGEESRAVFMADIARYVRETVDAIAAAGPTAPRSATPAPPTHATARRPRKPRTATAATARRAKPPAVSVAELTCPRCRSGALVTGKRGWGCARWREGCGFVIWFQTAGKLLSETQLRDLITRGKTRPARFPVAGAAAKSGRLILDASARDGAARFEPDPI